MTVSDIIVLMALVIAIVTLIRERNRDHILFKFSFLDIFALLFAFALINYFVFYDSFHSRGLYLKFLYFDHFGLHRPGNWAYPITVAAVIYMIYKIWDSFFPAGRREQVIRYYNQLVENGEVETLLNLIDRYHGR